MVGLELTTLESRGQCPNPLRHESFTIGARICPIYRQPIFYHKFERVNAIGTPCLSANIVNTQGVPIGVKAQTVRTS